MDSRFKFVAVLTFIGILAGGIHLSYGDYKGSGLSRLPMPALTPAARVAATAAVVSNVLVATSTQSAGEDGA